MYVKPPPQLSLLGVTNGTKTEEDANSVLQEQVRTLLFLRAVPAAWNLGAHLGHQGSVPLEEASTQRAATQERRERSPLAGTDRGRLEQAWGWGSFLTAKRL